MSWTTPKTWVDNELVTAALMNTQLRDNLNVLAEAVPPTGTLVSFAGSSVPTGWLRCDGAAVSRTVYAGLYSAIGTTFGTGDGSTTFNVPDLRGRFPLGMDNMGGTSANRVTATAADNLGGVGGAETHTLTTAEIPAHTHRSIASANLADTSGTNQVSNGSGGGTWNSNPNTGSAGGGGAHNNMPPYIALNYLIKT